MSRRPAPTPTRPSWPGSPSTVRRPRASVRYGSHSDLFPHQTVEFLEVGQESKEEPRHLTPNRPVGHAHAGGLMGPLGHFGHPRLELEGLLEALGDLANELVLRHGSGTSGAAGIGLFQGQPL